MTQMSAKVTLQRLFDDWGTNKNSGAVSATTAWKHEGSIDITVSQPLGREGSISSAKGASNLSPNRFFQRKRGP